MIRIAFALVLLLPRQDTPIDLKWKLTTGDVLTYQHTLTQTFQFASDEGSFSYKQVIEATERLEVLRLTLDGHYEMRQSLTRLKVTVDDKVAFDSETGKGDAETSALFREAMKNAQTFTMTPLGRPVGNGDVKLGLTGQGNEPMPMAVLSVPLPESPIARGKNWEVKARDENEQGCAMLSTTTYKIDAASSDGHTIRGETSLKFEKAPETMKLKKGDGRQRAVFDASAGVLRESELTFGLSMENKLDGKVVSVTSDLSSTTKLKDRTRK